MFGLGYFKGLPTEYVIKYAGGRALAQGPGLSFWYVRYKTSIAVVPTASTDSDFVFNELTSNFQEVTIQGQFTYRLQNPRQAAELLNFTVDPRFRTYVSNQPERIPQRISNVIQTETREEVRKRTLEQALNDTPQIARDVLERIRKEDLAGAMGAELLNLHFLSLRPVPEVAKALEADYQQEVLRRADEAIFARRAAAVEKERKIKENELNTDIALEQQREVLIAQQGANAQQEAEYRGKALEVEAQYRAKAMAMEAAAYADLDGGKIMSLAVREIGARSDSIVAALAALAQARPKKG